MLFPRVYIDGEIIRKERVVDLTRKAFVNARESQDKEEWTDY